MNLQEFKNRVWRTPVVAPLALRVLRTLRAFDRWRSWVDWKWRRLAKPARNSGTPNQLHIAIVSHHPALTRESKLAHAIRREGHRASLIMTTRLQGRPEIFENVLIARNEWHALRMLDEIAPDVAHLIAPWGGDLGMLRVLQHTRAKTVFDAYDCTEGMIKPEYLSNPQRCYEIERACFARADHICARSLEPQYLRRGLGYNMAGVTYFPDYCWKVPRQRPQRTVADGDELHIVYAGQVVPENRHDSKRFSYAQYIAVGRALAEQTIHLHIYPTPYWSRDRDFERYYSLYIAEAQQNRFFHFYRPLPFQELINRLPEYDAALHIFGPRVLDLGLNTEAKLRYSTTNKIFDYVEAGLPIVIHPGFHQHGLTRHYGEAVPVAELSVIRPQLVALLNNPPRTPVATAAIDSQSARLITMYRSIVRDNKQ